MSVSQNKLNEYITLYLNDVEDYYGERDLVLTESTLNSLKQLIVESKKDMSIVLKEALVNTIHNVSDRARNLFRLNMLHDICAVTNVGAQVH